MPKTKLVEENARHIAVLNSEMGEVRDELKRHTEILECHTKKWNQNEITHAKFQTDQTWIKETLVNQNAQFNSLNWKILGIAIAIIITAITKVIGLS